MINPTQISEIVKETLNEMGIHEPAIEKLIKGTFAFNSGLEYMYDIHSKRYGFMLLPEIQVRSTLHEYVKFKKPLRDKIYNTTGINVYVESMDILLDSLRSNVKFMVATLYAFYNSRNDDLMEDDLISVGSFYKKHYIGTEDIIVEEWIEYYREVFGN